MAASASAFAAFAAVLVFFFVPHVPFAFSAGSEPPSFFDRHEAQLQRLETLVETLSRSVSALESSLSKCSASAARSEQLLPSPVPDLSPASGAAAAAAAGGGGEGNSRGVAVTKHRTLWSERFLFAAAARLEDSAAAAAAAVLPYEDVDGLSKYFAVGDSRGRVYVFSAAGDVLIELPAFSESPVTALLAYVSRRNESLLFVGHADGSVAAHRLFESSANAADDWFTLSVAGSRLFIRGGSDSSPVLILEVHQIGRARYVITSDGSGRIRVFTENGTLYGTAIASSRPLAFIKQRLLFLTETGAGSLDLRSMALRETECEGLNGSTPKAYSFDLSERSKAYGFTVGGDLLHVVLLGDVANLKCRVRAMRKSEIESPVSIQTMKGYLLIASHAKVFVYNISSQFYGRAGAPRPLFFATLKEIKSMFVNSHATSDESLVGMPLIAADREKLVVLGFGDGYIGVYQSNFPAFKVESNAVVWSGPVLLFLLFLIGIWQFYVKKKDSLGWTPEESFNSPVAAAHASLLNHTGSDRAYADGARAGDLRELRGGGLRGAPRRYVSPPRFSAATGIPYRPVSADPGIRGPSELKYRGQNSEPSFGKRRDLLFQNTQVVEDHVE
ncbi:putative membrane protein [Ananas comosus]|uniref:Putative membrane protein n=1 Tax=Ananas comosus TaxID=4615 RepID=A0A199VUS6_ANACO|nr:putative membrane protein [Ananas comosus]